MGRHDTDILSLACAVIFLAVGAVFLTGEVDPAEFVRAWAFPMALLSAGLVLGALGVARHRRLHTTRQAPEGSEEEAHPPLW